MPVLFLSFHDFVDIGRGFRRNSETINHQFHLLCFVVLFHPVLTDELPTWAHRKRGTYSTFDEQTRSRTKMMELLTNYLLEYFGLVQLATNISV